MHVASSPPPCCVSPPLYPLHTSALARCLVSPPLLHVARYYQCSDVVAASAHCVARLLCCHPSLSNCHTLPSYPCRTAPPSSMLPLARTHMHRPLLLSSSLTTARWLRWRFSTSSRGMYVRVCCGCCLNSVVVDASWRRRRRAARLRSPTISVYQRRASRRSAGRRMP